MGIPYYPYIYAGQCQRTPTDSFPVFCKREKEKERAAYICECTYLHYNLRDGPGKVACRVEKRRKRDV